MKEKNGYGVTRINYAGRGYGRHCAGMTNIYGFNPDGFRFNYVVTYRRSMVIITLLHNGDWWNIHEDIRNNYSTNGYSTRVGLRKANLARCIKLADSHRAITGTGQLAHDLRVKMRNK